MQFSHILEPESGQDVWRTSNYSIFFHITGILKVLGAMESGQTKFFISTEALIKSSVSWYLTPFIVAIS